MTIQSPGSGKTFLCENMLNILHSDVEKKGPIYQSLVNGDSSRMPTLGANQCGLSDLRNCQKEVRADQIHSIVSARTIYIDLSLADDPPDVSLRTALLVMMYRKALNDESICYTGNALPMNYAGFCTVVEKRTGYNGKWFVVFDEIAAIEGSVFSKVTFDPPGKRAIQTTYSLSPQRGHISPDSRYYTFLDVVGKIAFDAVSSDSSFPHFLKTTTTTHQIKQSDKFFVFCAGKSTSLELSKISLRSSDTIATSPVTLHFLCIPPFEVNHVEEAIQSAFKNHHKKALQCDPMELAKAIFKASGGVPRLVNYILDYIVRHTKPASSEEELMTAFEASYQSRAKDAVVTPGLTTVEDRAIYSTLVMSSE